MCFLISYLVIFKTLTDHRSLEKHWNSDHLNEMKNNNCMQCFVYKKIEKEERSLSSTFSFGKITISHWIYYHFIPLNLFFNKIIIMNELKILKPILYFWKGNTKGYIFAYIPCWGFCGHETQSSLALFHWKKGGNEHRWNKALHQFLWRISPTEEPTEQDL